MLATIALVFGGFTWVVWRSFRRAASSTERYAPAGKLRWTEEPRP